MTTVLSSVPLAMVLHPRNAYSVILAYQRIFYKGTPVLRDVMTIITKMMLCVSLAMSRVRGVMLRDLRGVRLAPLATSGTMKLVNVSKTVGVTIMENT